MKAISYHLKAVVEVSNQLLKGRFLTYFIPGLVLTLIYLWFSYRAQAVAETVSIVSRIPLIGEYLHSGLSSVGSFFGFIATQVYIFAILTLLSPFNTHLSEKLDTHLTGQTFESGFMRIVNDFIRMIFIVFIALFLEFFFIGFWWLLTWVFGLSSTLIYDLGSFIMTSFFFGFSFYDHSLERYQKGVFGSLGFAFSRFWMVTLTGAVFNILYLFPFIGDTPYLGIVISPVLTTMISTVVYLYHIKKLSIVNDANSSSTNE